VKGEMDKRVLAIWSRYNTGEDDIEDWTEKVRIFKTICLIRVSEKFDR